MKMNLTSIFIASIALLVGVAHADEVCEEEQTFQEVATLDVGFYDEDCDELALLDEEDGELDCICEEDEHAIVDSRPLLPQTRIQMQQARQAEIEQADQITEEEGIELSVLMIPIKSQNLIALASNELNTTAAALTPCHYRTIANFPQQAIIKLDDGSEWVYDRADAYILRNWNIGDQIVISPKQQLIIGSHYHYMITNRTLGDSINVNLFLGPIAFGRCSTWVSGIDYNLGKVYIINGLGERTVWEFSSSDMYLVKDWKVNDTVIIGQNDSWLWYFSSYDSIIINVNMNHYVRATIVSNPKV